MFSSAATDTLPARFREYSGDKTRDVAIAFIVIEIVAVGLRYLAFMLSEKSFGIDDILMIPGLILCLALNTSALIGIRLGRVGYHLDVVKALYPEAMVPWAKVLVVTPIVYSAACMVPRVVILTLYLRIFPEKKYRIACYVLIAVVVALGVADILTGAFECIPIAYLWDKSIPGGRCIDLTQFFRYGTLPNVFVDLLMLVLPQPIIWKLQTSKQVKVGLAATILTGSVGLITSIMRCVAFFQSNPLEDGTWSSVTFLNWSIIEPGVYLLAACLPCYRPLILAVVRLTAKHSTKRSRTTYLNLSDSKLIDGRWKNREVLSTLSISNKQEAVELYPYRVSTKSTKRTNDERGLPEEERMGSARGE